MDASYEEEVRRIVARVRSQGREPTAEDFGWQGEPFNADHPTMADLEDTNFVDDPSQREAKLRQVLQDGTFASLSKKEQEAKVAELLMGHKPDWLLTDEERRAIEFGDDREAQQRLVYFAPLVRNLVDHPTLNAFDPSDTEEESDAEVLRKRDGAHVLAQYPLVGDATLKELMRQPNTILWRVVFHHYHQTLLHELVVKQMKLLRRELHNIRCSPANRQLLDNLVFSSPVPLPVRIKKWTVLRSPHVNKRARDQFEQRVHRLAIGIAMPYPEENKRPDHVFLQRFEDWLGAILTKRGYFVSLTRHEYAQYF